MTICSSSSVLWCVTALQPATTAVSYKTSPAIITLPACFPLVHSPSVSHPSLLAMALLSSSLLSEDARRNLWPLQPQFPARWRRPCIYVQYSTRLVVYVYVRLLLACDPGSLSRSTTLKPPPSLFLSYLQPLRFNQHPQSLLLHKKNNNKKTKQIKNRLSNHTALLIPKRSMPHKLLLLHGSVCVRGRVCVCVFGRGINLPICRQSLI